ncbi:MAG: cytochrome b/b6 domain-containing protein, partial [Chromatiaceae bacterium]
MTQPTSIGLEVAPAAMGGDRARRVRVWDPLVRLFHWSLAAAVLIAFLTEDEQIDLHLIAGYSVLALIGFRLVWGLVGPRHARWSDFVRGPR